MLISQSVVSPCIHRRFSLVTRRFGQILMLLYVLCGAALVTGCGGDESSTDGQKPAAAIDTSADIQASSLRGQAPFTVTLDGSGSRAQGQIVSFSWALGDGATASTENTSHTYMTEGEYTVQLTVVDSNGKTATDTITVSVLGGDATFKLYGTVSAMPYLDVDGDTNDPEAPRIPNNGSSDDMVQPLANPVLLSGYLTFEATSAPRDAFQSEADVSDVYSVVMEEGEYASVKIAEPSAGDIDLFLLDAANFDVIASSTSEGEFESVRAPQSAAYYVAVRITQGASNYQLKLGEDSFVSGGAAAGQSGDFEPMQAVVKLVNNSTAIGSGKMQPVPEFFAQAQIALTHSSHKRATLARINPLNPQTKNRMKLRALSGLEQRLARSNPEALAKLQTLQALKDLRKQSAVQYAELNYKVKPKLTPNDPYFNLQWGYPMMNLPNAWDSGTGSAEVIVAVLDSGVYYDHPELQGQLVGGYDFVSEVDNAGDGDGVDSDPSDPGDAKELSKASWHGTHVAGAVVAKMNNRTGITGVAPGAKVMPLRVLGQEDGSVYDVLQAVRYAAGLDNDSGALPDKTASIINLSLGGAGYSQSSQNLYNEVREKGIFLVAASGNENSSEPMYPASYAGVVSVAAFDYRGERAPYSNYSPHVDVAAPGGHLSADLNSDGYGDGVLSLTVSGSTLETLSPNYAFYQGTSVAAPQVAGIIALMKSAYPALTPGEFDSLLINGDITTELGEPGHDEFFGYGAIDALRAVNAAKDLAAGGETAAVISSLRAMNFDNITQRKTLNLAKAGNGDIQVIAAEISVDWLDVLNTEVDAQGFGNYDIYVNREGMSHGTYEGTITFQTSANTAIVVNVSMRIGDDVETGNAGRIYIMLIDATTEAVVASQSSLGVDGEYPYAFNEVSVGDYYIAAGTDVNNNGVVCDGGEICGYYPSYEAKKAIRLTSDQSHLNFYTGLFDAPQVSAASAGFTRLEPR